MEIIQKQVGIINKLVGKQIKGENQKYRLSDFCVDCKTDSKHIIYNNLTKQMVELSCDEYESLKDINDNLDLRVVTELINDWFIVPVTFDEYKLSNQIKNTVKCFNTDRSVTFYNILTTTACNARCFYCFESGTRIVSMNAPTANATAKYILNNCGNREIKIQWFGGEPLCNIEAIDIISQELKKKQMSYSSIMITNGYLFNEDIIKRAISAWHLKMTQITIDGMSDTYNTVKNYRCNDGNPFATVMNNIELLIKYGIEVQVRLNMDTHNADELKELIDYIYNRFGTIDNLHVYAKMLYENKGFNPIDHTDADRIEMQKKYYDICRYLDMIGLSRPEILYSKIMINRCQADSCNSVQITPEGNLANCEHYPVDDYYGNVFNNDRVIPWNDYVEKTDLCRGCAYYPTCLILKRCNTNGCNQYRKVLKNYELKKAVKCKYKLLVDHRTDI